MSFGFESLAAHWDARRLFPAACAARFEAGPTAAVAIVMPRRARMPSRLGSGGRFVSRHPRGQYHASWACAVYAV
eukprot:5806451-Pyramimonas_sp.AAC.1